MSTVIDLGGGHYLRPVVDGDGKPWGWVEEHPDAQRPGHPCSGSVARRGATGAENRPQWDVLSEEPITLSPSIVCRGCGAHGWIRDGRWVPA